jgi:TPR repeat protein
VGLKADIGKAKEWYKKAAELGSKEAVNRLAALETAPR